ncbi:helix-turn-helix transcriptional regulator [Ferruginibacter profundus]
MELIERDGFLALLQTHFKNIEAGEGHCVLVSGEAGIGKSALVKVFCKAQKEYCNIYQGVCDSLFTPRPLAPLYDVMWQVNHNVEPGGHHVEERSALFAGFFRELSNQKEKIIIVFEDIHWADEATLDFIKFFVRRITQLPCLFILTYRDNEIHSRHPLRNVLGHLPPDSFTHLQLAPLSREAVEKMALEKGYSGEDVYKISGGNPFYVNEILASYSKGIPDNIKNAILSTYNSAKENTKLIWELLSVIPSSFEIKYLEKIEPAYASAIENCINTHILIINEGRIYFKHELFRRAIESSLSPLKRIFLNKRILDLFQDRFEQNDEIERIVHHAKNANEYEKVVQYALLAAGSAAAVGAHTEASKLYLSAIEYYQGNDKHFLIQLYEAYAYECYLTNQTKEAIIYSSKALPLLKENSDKEKIGNCLRFLSWLWWINDNLKKAEEFATQSIEVLDNQPSSRAKAMAYSNLSQLKMFSDLLDECIYWGEKAIAMAKELSDNAILSDALGNVGSAQIRIPALHQKGVEKLELNLGIALQNSYHEHAARAYTNLAYNGIIIKDNELVKKYLEAGIRYCEENDLDLWVIYMLTVKSRLKLETGNWNEACDVAEMLMKNGEQTKLIEIYILTVLATVKMRRGDNEGLLNILTEAKSKAFETMELQRIIQVMTAFLEYEWITGQQFIDEETIDSTIKRTEKMGNIYANSEFAFWLLKARGQHLALEHMYEGYETGSVSKAQKAAALWKKKENPYNEALLLFEGNEDDKRKALTIVQGLGADAVHEKMKSEMRTAGIKNIPRGIRKTTQSNPLFLTDRELDVLQLLKESLQNKEIAGRLFISAKTVDHHISSILFKLDVNSRTKAVSEALRLQIIK